MARCFFIGLPTASSLGKDVLPNMLFVILIAPRVEAVSREVVGGVSVPDGPLVDGESRAPPRGSEEC